jgi:hypothetical protein
MSKSLEADFDVGAEVDFLQYFVADHTHSLDTNTIVPQDLATILQLLII